MKFSKDFLKDRLGDKALVSEITGHGRWSVHHMEVFEYEGKFYRTEYSVGATESQDERPYKYDKAEIECPEVRPVEKLITVYEEV